MDEYATGVHSGLLAKIKAWDPVWGQSRWSDEQFNGLALQLFAYQYEHNLPYRRFCDGRDMQPGNVTHYRQIPAVPTDVFKLMALSTSKTNAVCFKTSGTTQGKRGAHFMGNTTMYEASLLGPFARYCLPENQTRQMIMLHPSADHLPDSSLSFMLQTLANQLGTSDSFWAVTLEDSQWQWDIDALCQTLDTAVEKGEPVLLLGTAFGFMHVLDHTTRSWALPAGSVIMETGGFKGRSRTLEKAEMYTLFEARFGVKVTRCVSEYSMTELSAQAYTNNLHELIMTKKRLTLEKRRFQTPPWARVEVVDPMTLEVNTQANATGLLRWYDLSNFWSVLAVQTSDMGRVDAVGRFELLGRAQEAQLRGCSLTIEEIALHLPQ